MKKTFTSTDLENLKKTCRILEHHWRLESLKQSEYDLVQIANYKGQAQAFKFVTQMIDAHLDGIL